LFVAVLLFYPLIYYVTHTFEGFTYQYPMHPEMLALAASAVVGRGSAMAQTAKPFARIHSKLSHFSKRRAAA
jgi:hypothetical protein